MHYLGEVENIYNTLWRIYSGQKHKNLSESVWFCRRCDKNIWCVFWFAVPIAVHLQNANAKFHKVV